MRAFVIVILILTATLWLWGLRRAGTLFSLVIREGRISRSSGRIPPRLLADIAEIIERAGVIRGKIRGVSRDGKPVLLFEGELSPGVQQQMRNVVGQFSTGQIRTSKKH